MAKITVVCGGNSAEREVSLRSGAAVAQALAEAGYEVRTLESATVPIEEIVDCDVVFPVLHGAGGEDGSLQAELEKHGAKYVGSGPEASELCFDKWAYRELITAQDLPMAAGGLVRYSEYSNHELAQRPFVLKPLNGGSSIDTYIMRDVTAVPREAVQETFSRYPTMLLEELIEGTELTVGVLGDAALPIIKIVPPESGEFDYENKYNGASQEIVAPQDVTTDIQKAAQELALKAHRLAGCRDFSRTDIMCNKDGQLFLLETNTIPGMTAQSLFPKMAAAAGLPMPALCKKLVEMALKR